MRFLRNDWGLLCNSTSVTLAEYNFTNYSITPNREGLQEKGHKHLEGRTMKIWSFSCITCVSSKKKRRVSKQEELRTMLRARVDSRFQHEDNCSGPSSQSASPTTSRMTTGYEYRASGKICPNSLQQAKEGCGFHHTSHFLIIFKIT